MTKVTILPAAFAYGIASQYTCKGRNDASRYWNEETAWERLGAFKHARLFKAKLAQMFLDLASKSNGYQPTTDRNMAFCFFASNTDDFYTTCDLAGYHPDFVRKTAKRIQESGFQFRADPGQHPSYARRKAYHARAGR